MPAREIVTRIPAPIRRALALIGIAVIPLGRPVQAQRADRAGQALTIPYLANASRPADLDYAAAVCEVAVDGSEMHCRFRQLFLTPTSIDPTSCAVTTNGYDRVFRRETGQRWVSRSAPEGPCGIVESTTLDDGGGTHWTMTVRTSATRAAGGPECQVSPPPDVYDWRGVKRPLPCTSIQPGAIER